MDVWKRAGEEDARQIANAIGAAAVETNPDFNVELERICQHAYGMIKNGLDADGAQRYRQMMVNLEKFADRLRKL